MTFEVYRTSDMGNRGSVSLRRTREFATLEDLVAWVRTTGDDVALHAQPLLEMPMLEILDRR